MYIYNRYNRCRCVSDGLCAVCSGSGCWCGSDGLCAVCSGSGCWCVSDDLCAVCSGSAARHVLAAYHAGGCAADRGPAARLGSSGAAPAAGRAQPPAHRAAGQRRAPRTAAGAAHREGSRRVQAGESAASLARGPELDFCRWGHTTACGVCRYGRGVSVGL